MAAIEDLSGRRKYLPLYRKWQTEIAPDNPRMITDLLELIEVELTIATSSEPWPYELRADEPLIMIANHPYGLSDGMVACALAEQLNRPYKVLINNDLLKIPEIRPYSLPIDFSESREAMKTNLRSRAEAKELLASGTTIIVFPAGGVATAPNPFGKAEELPWKTFTARLVQLTRASVLPVFFPGQNSAIFHAVSRLSLTLRLSLLLSEFRRFPYNPFTVHVGNIIRFDQLEHANDRARLSDELYRRVQELNPDAPDDPELIPMPRPLSERPKYPGLT